MTATFELTKALLIYEDPQTAICTVNPVKMIDGKPIIGAGRPLSRSGLSTLVHKLSGVKQRREISDTRVLYADPSRMAWWSPAKRCPIYFKTVSKGFNRWLNAKVVSHPALMFVADPEKLCVYALKENVRPDSETPLYRAPYFNIYEAGNMCSGNIRMPSTISVLDIVIWEDAFYRTEFTHSNRSILTSHRNGHAGYWVEALRTLPEQMAKHLIPLNMTAAEALNR